MLNQNLLDYFTPEEQQFIKNLNERGQLFITQDENATLPSGVTHILLIESGGKPELIRKRFY